MSELANLLRDAANSIANNGSISHLVQVALDAADELDRRAPAASAVPEGWKLVPVEPTKEMIAAVQGSASYPRARELIVADWRDMLAAAPVEGGGK